MKKLAALLVALMMIASMALAESTDDPIVVKAGDVEIRLSEAQEFFDYYYDQYVQLYAENGMAFTQEDVDYLLQAIVDSLAQNAVMDAKIKEYGLDNVTDADKQALREELEVLFEEDLAAYAESVGLSVEEARETVAAQGLTAESIYEQNVVNLPYIRLQEYAVKDVSVSDEDVTAEYDAYVAEDKAAYENDIATYEMYTTYYGAQDIFYMPEGYRYIKHILLAIPEDIAALMNDYQTDMNSVQSRIDTLSDELYAVENPSEEAQADATATASARTAEEIQAEIDEQNEQLTDLRTKYEDARAQVLPSLQPTIDEINKKLSEGASFDSLIEEYNTDTGVATAPEGYKVHKDSVIWDTTFRDAAMALAKIGDISEPVITNFGVHILEYAGDVPSGAVEMTSEVASGLKESMLTAKQDEAFTNAFDTWMSEITVETHPELIKLPDVEADAAQAAQSVQPAAEETPAPEATENADGSVG